MKRERVGVSGDYPIELWNDTKARSTMLAKQRGRAAEIAATKGATLAGEEHDTSSVLYMRLVEDASGEVRAVECTREEAGIARVILYCWADVPDGR